MEILAEKARAKFPLSGHRLCIHLNAAGLILHHEQFSANKVEFPPLRPWNCPEWLQA